MELSLNYWCDHDTIAVLNLSGLERVAKYSPEWPKIEVRDYIEVKYQLPPGLLSTRLVNDMDIYLDWLKEENQEFDPNSDGRNGFGDWKRNFRPTHPSAEEEEPSAKFSKLLQQLQTCYDNLMHPYGIRSFIMPRNFILNNAIEEGDCTPEISAGSRSATSFATL